MTWPQLCSGPTTPGPRAERVPSTVQRKKNLCEFITWKIDSLFVGFVLQRLDIVETIAALWIGLRENTSARNVARQLIGFLESERWPGAPSSALLGICSIHFFSSSTVDPSTWTSVPSFKPKSCRVVSPLANSFFPLNGSFWFRQPRRRKPRKLSSKRRDRVHQIDPADV
jgi:hypothetical protein